MIEGNLPDGWTMTTIGNVADTTSGGTPLRNHMEYFDGKIPWIKSGELRDEIIRDAEETITDVGLKNSSAKLFSKDTVLVALYGTTVGRTGILGIDAASNQAVCGITPRNNAFISKYMFYWLQSQRPNLINQSVVGTQPNISQDIVRSLAFPLAPLPEQERIVAKIEELFTQLEAGTAGLKHVWAELKRYKASVLKAMIEGRLFGITEEDNNYEMPNGWGWTTLGALAIKQRYAISSGPFDSALGTKDYQDSGIPVIRSHNIKNGKFSLENLAYISSEKASQLVRSITFPGDLVIVAVGSSAQPAIVPEQLPKAILSQNCNKITLDSTVALGEYILFALQTEQAQKQMLEKATDTTRPFLSLTNLKKTIIPLPPLAEQQRIVAEVERRLSVTAQMESVLEASVARAERLRQSVLQAAFEGMLG